MNPQQTIVQNTLYLNELDSSLKSLQKGEKFYLKIENNRVVVIKRHFSNLFQWLSAAVGTFFGRKEYDLGRIATLFTHELQAIQNAEKALPISQRIHAYVAGSDRTLLCNTAVANLQLPKFFEVPKQSDRDTVIGAKNRINFTLQTFDRLAKRPEFQKKGSLSEAVFTELRTTLRVLWDKKEATLPEITPPYLEAQHLIRAIEGKNEVSKNAYRLMQLRALLEKAIAFAEKTGLPTDDLLRQWEHFHISTDGKEHYLKRYATPDYQLEEIERSILAAIAPLEEAWGDDLKAFTAELDLLE